MSTLLFVYGTLKSGCVNHHHLAGQKLVGPARTQPGYRLYDLGGFPGIMVKATDREGVVGEVWAIDAPALGRLDEFEGVHQGLYRRGTIRLLPPFAAEAIDAYFPTADSSGLREVGGEWRE